MSETAAQKNLLSRLHEAQRDANAVGKRGRNERQNYNYARAEDVIAEAQRALHDQGLIATMAYSDHVEREVESNNGAAGIYITLAGALRIADPGTGEVLEVPGFGAGIDYPGDKAVYKAMTGAAKYAYASALGIPFGDDPENETQDTQRSSSTNATTRPPSEPQRGLLEKLLKEAKLSGEDLAVVLDYSSSRLTGGKAGTASSAIDALMKDKEATAAELLSRAKKWASEQSVDPPPDMSDLPEAA